MQITTTKFAEGRGAGGSSFDIKFPTWEALTDPEVGVIETADGGIVTLADVEGAMNAHNYVALEFGTDWTADSVKAYGTAKKRLKDMLLSHFGLNDDDNDYLRVSFRENKASKAKGRILVTLSKRN